MESSAPASGMMSASVLPVRIRSIACRITLTLAVGLTFAGLWARTADEDGEAIATLLGAMRARNVNDAGSAAVNESPDDAGQSARHETMDPREFIVGKHEQIRSAL